MKNEDLHISLEDYFYMNMFNSLTMKLETKKFIVYKKRNLLIEKIKK